ncbi:MAG: ABC transporter ATP-binding protein [Pseudopedobacter saltans]|uniref:ABC transporter ATP-binding protein n=1 Tax=Pseudopedobacter saltans TaxID=151895 RepID=A0A2W5H2V5_9SPHI|nr:MAG: ABC transporter ATP-binding protein [Pseudopedobacter saltans]
MRLLEVQNLKKYYTTQKAVDDISFSIEEGTIFGLLGPNGAGKTTLLRMITGIFLPDEGSVLLDGNKIDLEKSAAHIGYMPEERGLYKKMKIGEQAVYLAQLKGLSASEALESAKYWFSRLKIESWWNKKLEDLSKGMGQKLQFVTTVMHNPRLIILDEPFSGLDPVNADLIKNEIFELAKQGKTIIFSTHRMEQVEEICDHIVLVNAGKKLLDGSVKEVKNQYKENLWRLSFRGDASTLTDRLFNIISQKEDELILQLHPATTTNDALGYFIEKNIAILGFNELLPSLNDIFIHLVENTGTVTRSFSK